MMKLGMIIGKSENGFKYAASKGLEYAEICIHPSDFDAEGNMLMKAEDYNAWAGKYNMKVGSTGCWGFEPLNKDGTPNEIVMKIYRNAIDFAAAVGSPVLHVGANDFLAEWEVNRFRRQCDAAINMLRIVSEYAEKKGIRLSLYNCGWSNFANTPEAWSIIIPAVPGLGIKYDVSHCRTRGGDYLAEMRDFGKYICHVHIKGTLDIEGKIFDYPPAGLDNTNWGAVFNMLYINNYDGMISMEPESMYWHGDMVDFGLDFSLDYIKKFIRK